MIESLEARRLLSNSVWYIGSTDTVAVELDGGDDMFKAKIVSSLNDTTFGGATTGILLIKETGGIGVYEVDNPLHLDDKFNDTISFPEGSTPKYLVGTMGERAFVMPLGSFIRSIGLAIPRLNDDHSPFHISNRGNSSPNTRPSIYGDSVYVANGNAYASYTNPTNPRLRVEAQGGDDLVTIDSSVKNIRVSIFGANGNDTIVGGTYIDSLYGGAGDDVITSFAKIRAYIEGNGGNDILKGGSAPDSIQGDAGDDWLDGGPAGSLTGDTSTQPQQRAMPNISARKPTNTGTNTGINTSTSTHTPLSNYTIDHLYGGSDYDIAVRDDHDYREGIEHLI